MAARALGVAPSREARQELRPFFKAAAAAGGGRGFPVTGVAAAAESRPSPGVRGRLRAAAVLLAPNRPQGVSG